MNNNIATKDEMHKEALRRIDKMTKKYRLRPIIMERLEKREVSYSYKIDGFVGGVDFVSYKEVYQDIIDLYQKNTNNYVYHCIEDNNKLALLYVSHNKKNWDLEYDNILNLVNLAVYTVGSHDGSPVIEDYEINSDEGALVYYSPFGINRYNMVREGDKGCRRQNDEFDYFYEEIFCNCSDAEIAEAFDNSSYD